MTTWTIKVAKPTESGGTTLGFGAAASTGLTFDDSVALKAWCPAGSTAAIRVARLMGLLEEADEVGFKYFADNGGGTVLAADKDGGGIRQES